MYREPDLDLGNGFSLRYFGWAPDRSLNPQYDDLDDVEKLGAIITCPHGEGSIHFKQDNPRYYDLFGPRTKWWTVEKWEPLTISPSVLCPGCGCHGFIREGKWVNA